MCLECVSDHLYDDGLRPDFEGLGAGRIITGPIADWWGHHRTASVSPEGLKVGLVSVLARGPGTGCEKVIRRMSPEPRKMMA